MEFWRQIQYGQVGAGDEDCRGYEEDWVSALRQLRLWATVEQADGPQRKYEKAMEDIILQYTYPRIDAEVSKHRNHLLKAPFCVHPGTGQLGR